MKRTSWVAVIGASVLSAFALPLFGQATSIGSDRIQVLNLYTQVITGTEAGGELPIKVPTGIALPGTGISMTAAAGVGPLFGPFVDEPLEGGKISLWAGNGAPEYGDFKGSKGGDIDIVAGSGGSDTGTGETGDGGTIFLTPGGPGPDSGHGGGLGVEGAVVVNSNVAGIQPEMVVNSVGVTVVRMLTLPTRTDTPTCDSLARGSMWVYDRGTSDPDAVCVCLDTTGSSSFAWVDLTGGGGCPT